eukprot:COSAG02_NODE_231_length_27944_cov_5.843347_16_plen_124_part_00
MVVEALDAKQELENFVSGGPLTAGVKQEILRSQSLKMPVPRDTTERWLSGRNSRGLGFSRWKLLRAAMIDRSQPRVASPGVDLDCEDDSDAECIMSFCGDDEGGWGGSAATNGRHHEFDRDCC